jgi:hypothetical protein
LKQIDFLQLAAKLQSSGQAPAVMPASLKRLNITARKETTHHGAEKDLVPTLELIKRAVEAGELDAQIEVAAVKLRDGFGR